MTTTRARDRVPAIAADNVGSVRYARVSQDARTVHAVRSRADRVAMCGVTATWGTHGEEHRLPLCARCHKVAEAEFLAELDEEI